MNWMIMWHPMLVYHWVLTNGIGLRTKNSPLMFLFRELLVAENKTQEFIPQPTKVPLHKLHRLCCHGLPHDKSLPSSFPVKIRSQFSKENKGKAEASRWHDWMTSLEFLEFPVVWRILGKIWGFWVPPCLKGFWTRGSRNSSDVCSEKFSLSTNPPY